MSDAIEIVRDDGSMLVLSRSEARRVHDAFDRAVLLDGLRGDVRVGRCARECVACANAKRRRA